jgi:nucleoside-diphosphate-sugar epimerase
VTTERRGFASERELDEFMATPTDRLIEFMTTITDGILVLGAGGKMGHTLCTLAKRAADAAGHPIRIVAVSRFSNRDARSRLEHAGVETIACDLLDPASLESLPVLSNVVFMVGRKFGSTGDEPTTWAMNAYLPGVVAERFAASRHAVFSTGNVYPFVPPASGGADEATPTSPIGEYAQSCLGRERVFEYFSHVRGTPVVLVRLNYAIDMRYGILLDLAERIQNGRLIDLSMSHVNVIWQGDACDAILRSLESAASPPAILNVTGSETLSVRDLAHRLGEALGVRPTFTNAEQPTALLSDNSRAVALLGPPRIEVAEMIRWTADWVMRDGRTLGKPTHFSERGGRF